MRTSHLAPELATPRALARTTGGLYIAGGIIAAAVTAGLSQLPEATAMLMFGVTAVALLVGGALLVVGRRLPRWAFHVVVAMGTVLITVVVGVCPSANAAVGLAAVYTLVAVDVFFFFAWPTAVVHLVFMLVLEVTALAGHPRVDVLTAAAIGGVCVTTAVVVGRLVQLASSAHRDSLTGLRNRRGFDDALQEALVTAERSGQLLSVALVDIDHFKRVNDTRGHAAGDELLCATAAECAAGLPDAAVLGRRGGDEFAVLLPGADGAAAHRALEAMRASASRAGLSCGVAQHLGGESAAEVLRRADAALYAAKAAGRGRTVLSSIDAERSARRLTEDLAEAIGSDQLHVAFQPIVSLPGERVVGVEALARWTHPERGSVPPAVFIPAAEAAGLVVDLGAAVLAAACRGATALREVHGEHLLLTVNVSGRELTEPGHAAAVLRILATTGWPAERLVLEVTESLLEASDPVALETLAELRRHGVAVAIDDFGTGYSAFARLDTLPADHLKLDHSFTSTITTSPSRAAMLQALIGLSRDLGLTVVAEGVEHPAQSRLLAELGCPLAQGYLYGRPRSASEVVTAQRARTVGPTAGGQRQPAGA